MSTLQNLFCAWYFYGSSYCITQVPNYKERKLSIATALLPRQSSHCRLKIKISDILLHSLLTKPQEFNMRKYFRKLRTKKVCKIPDISITVSHNETSRCKDIDKSYLREIPLYSRRNNTQQSENLFDFIL